jgi:hypothetical protein
MRRPPVVLGLVAALACAPKAPPALAPARPALLVAALEPLADAPPRGLPPRAEARLVEALRGVGLDVAPVPAADFGPALHTRRTPEQRTAWLQSQAGDGAPLLVVVAAEAHFYSQIEGRLRWTVSVELLLAAPSASDRPVVHHFEVPVFLQFLHEKEDAAVDAAAPVIARQVASFAGAWSGGL